MSNAPLLFDMEANSRHSDRLVTATIANPSLR